MDLAMDEDIAANLESVRQRLEAACRRIGRRAGDVSIIAVTKTVSPERVRAAYELGLADFGENRVQEAREKLPALRDLPLRWHMIGHLQRNKAKQAVELFSMVQSVDSVEIAEHLDRYMQARGGVLPVLLEINIGGEAAKSGFARPDNDPRWSEFLAAVGRITALAGLDVRGLMTVAPLLSDPELARPYFHDMLMLRERLRREAPQVAWAHLSMGMTDDFEVAVEEGATMVRLGRALFGPRPF
jgi:pyridoxal phosphate enzyme (YggS family)